MSGFFFLIFSTCNIYLVYLFMNLWKTFIKDNFFFSFFRNDLKPWDWWGLGLQPIRAPNLRKHTYTGWSGFSDCRSLPGAAGPLSQHLQPGGGRFGFEWSCGGRSISLPRWPYWPLFRANQFCKGVGTQILAPRGDGLSLLDRGSLSTL